MTPRRGPILAGCLNSPRPTNNTQIADGEGYRLAIFREECATCHEEDACGDDEGFVPSLCNQTYSIELGGPEVLPRLSTKAHADIVTLGALSRSGLQRAFIGDSDSRNRQFNPVRKPLPFPRDSLAEQPRAVHELVAARLLFS